MHRWFLLSTLLISVVSSGCSLFHDDPSIGADDFEGRTVRVSLHHGQKDGKEWFEIRSLHDEGDWTGSIEASRCPSGFRRIEPFEQLGLYRASVIQGEGGLVRYALGYCSVFGEWLTTDDAKQHPDKVFEESIRLPKVRGECRLRIEKRDRENHFVPIFETPIDLASVPERTVAPSAVVTEFGVRGDAGAGVDIVFLSEGYAESERAKFLGDVERLGEALFQVEPYRSLRSEIELRAVFVPSKVSGVSKPDQGIERESALGCRYSTFGLPRYVLTLEDERVRTAASAVPYDAIVILLNDSEYGGGGIFEQYCVVAADSPVANYLLIHEFGHSFSGLGDEYYTSPVAYNDFVAKNVEPWEPNVTALLDPAGPKWRDLVDGSTAIPTKWGKSEYESLQKDVRERETKWREEGVDSGEIAQRAASWRADRLAQALAPSGVVGAFEGALYSSTGLYRPEVDCIMFRREATRYCQVCERAIRRRISGWEVVPPDGEAKQ